MNESPILLVVSVACASFLLGWILGWSWSDRQWEQSARVQQQRGDYWFDKYMARVNPEWNPIAEWNDDPEL